MSRTGLTEAMEMLNQELEAHAIQCAMNVKPVPLGERQIELLIKRMAKSNEPAQVLANKLSQHNKYWSARYGLLDAVPFKMCSDVMLRAKWANGRVDVEFLDQPSMVVINCKDVKQLLIKLANKYSSSVVLQDQKESGELCIYGQAYPQHDWHHFTLAMERLANKKVVKKLIKQYRAGKSSAKNIKELSQLIIGYDN